MPSTGIERPREIKRGTAVTTETVKPASARRVANHVLDLAVSPLSPRRQPGPVQKRLAASTASTAGRKCQRIVFRQFLGMGRRGEAARVFSFGAKRKACRARCDPRQGFPYLKLYFNGLSSTPSATSNRFLIHPPVRSHSLGLRGST